MPRIKEYTASDRELSQDSTGFAAFETAGRRIGPAFDQAATSYAKIGQTRAADIKDRIWPWDMLALEDQQKSSGSGGSSGGGRGGHGGITGGVNNLYNEKEGSSRGGGDGSTARTSAGAGAIGKLASGLATTGKYSNSPDPNYSGTRQVLENGELKTVKVKNGHIVGDHPNKGAEEAANDYGKGIAGVPIDTTGENAGGRSSGDYGGDNSVTGDALGEPGADYSNGGWWSGVTDALSSALDTNKTGGSSEDYGNE